MLNGIKHLINSKIAMQESANAILEGSVGMDLDDAIVLGEDSEMDDDIQMGEDTDEPGDPNDPVTDENPPAEGDGDNEPESLPGEDDEANDSTGEISDPFDDQVDDLPTPIGAQTGEPVNDDIEDIMKMEIDLKSNTMSNVLPVPPANAGEAIASDDIGTQHVDSGFGGSTTIGDGDQSEFGEKADEMFVKWSDNLTKVDDNYDDITDKIKKILYEDYNDALKKHLEENHKEIGDMRIPNPHIRVKGHLPVLRSHLRKTGKLPWTETSDGKHAKGLCTIEVSWRYKGQEDNVERDHVPDHYFKVIKDSLSPMLASEIKIDNSENLKFDDPSKYHDYSFEVDILISIPALLKGVDKSMLIPYNEFKKNDGSTPVTEGISLAGGMGDEQSATDPTGDPAPSDDASSDPAPDTGENAVTAAVRDKVNEADAIEDPIMDDGSSPSATSKEDLLKRLGNITKNIEDTKKAIMDLTTK